MTAPIALAARITNRYIDSIARAEDRLWLAIRANADARPVDGDPETELLRKLQLSEVSGDAWQFGRDNLRSLRDKIETDKAVPADMRELMSKRIATILEETLAAF